MTNDWDFYALRVDDEPASIFVDLGVESHAPMHSHPNMAYIRLHLNQPRPDGLSSRDEYDALIAIEDAIESELCCDEVGYVGRNTSGGCRDFYLYLSSADDWPGKVDRVLAAFPAYKHEAGSRSDPGWSTYLNFLLPGAIDRQRIENRRVCEELERHGDALTAQREIDHWSYFKNREGLDAFLAQVEAAGFAVRATLVDEERPLPFGAQIWRLDVPSYGGIDDVTLPLFEAAARHGGDYDGWECPVIAPPGA